MDGLVGLVPDTVQIDPGQGTAVAAVDHAVWVEHRDDF